MATPEQIETTLAAYYEAWSDNDPALYRTVWAQDAIFADPPTDDELPPLGADQIVAAMADVQSRASSIRYERHRTWRCGHSLAVHSTVTMGLPGSGGEPEVAVAEVPIIHVFRFNEDGLIRRLEAFLDFDQVTMVRGERPGWMPPAPL